MDVLAEILKWHLAGDNRPPLKVVDDKLVPVENPVSVATPESASDMAPDKIVVYCELPSSFTQIVHVSSLLPFPFLTINSPTLSGLGSSQHKDP